MAESTVGVLTVIPSELRMMLKALGIKSRDRQKTSTGTAFYIREFPESRNSKPIKVVVSCIGHAGNYDSSAATMEMIHCHSPQLLILCGIAAGIRGRTKIGDVIISQAVLGYESGSLSNGRLSPRPEGGRIDHATTQDVATYLAGELSADKIWKRLFAEKIQAPPDMRAEFKKNVAARLTIHEAVIASGEKLLRDPNKLLKLRKTHHSRIEAGEMEAVGFWTAAHLAGTSCLIVRGVSDFGDHLKNDRFHEFAAASASAVVADFIRSSVALDQDSQTKTAVQPSKLPQGPVLTKLRAHFPALHETPLRLIQAETHLQLLCERARYVSEALDGALEQRDIARFNRTKRDEAQVSVEIQMAIISYIALYLDCVPTGDLCRFEIRFTDSRALWGPERMREWLDDTPYLHDLSELTQRAAAHFPREGLVSRTFIIPSFSELASDPALRQPLTQIIRAHLEAGVPVSLLSLSRLEDWGLDAVNFCLFKAGLLMTLDIAPGGELSVFEAARHRDDLNQVHEDLGRDQDGVFVLSQLADLKKLDVTKRGRRGTELMKQVALEGGRDPAVFAPHQAGNAGRDYTEDVARWWSDPQWDNERRSVEKAFLLGWLKKHIGDPYKEVLDTACGTGVHAFIAAEHGYTVTACDASWHQIGRAKLMMKRLGLRDPKYTSNPFFRTLRWTELGARYPRRFHALLCLGGSMIHASAAELPAVAHSMVAASRPGGSILIDHREIEFFREPSHRQTSHPGHRREVDVDFTTRHVSFYMRDNRDEAMTIEGRIHSIPEIVAAFEGAGARLIADDHDHSFQLGKGIPEWHHLTFAVA
jgi:nucleoside phosphorylase/SAM-dependent methyltransferase